MKKIYFLLIAVSAVLNAQTITIADAAFKAKLLSASTTNFVAGTGSFTSGYIGNFVIDQNGDGEIQLSEAQAIQYLDVRGVLGSSNTIHSLAGIENFSNLEVFFCQFNSLTTLDLSVLPNLNTVNCESNQLTSLNANGLTDLRYLFMRNNRLTHIDFSSLTSLEAAAYAKGAYLISITTDEGSETKRFVKE